MKNNFMVIGHIGRAPEEKQTKSGANYVTFSLAESIGKKVNGEWINETQWFDCFSPSEFIIKKVMRYTKGDRVIITGNIKINTYQNKDGIDVTKVSIVVNDIDIAMLKPKGEPAQQPAPKAKDVEADDDLPF